MKAMASSARPTALLLAAAASALACSTGGEYFGRVRAKDAEAMTLVFNNSGEPEYIDPGLATGHNRNAVLDTIICFSFTSRGECRRLRPT